MSNKVLKVKLAIAKMRYYPLIRKYLKSPQKSVIDMDIERWLFGCNKNAKVNVDNLVEVLFTRPQFRNLFFYRIRSHSNFLLKLCPPDQTLTIADDCGEIEGGVYFEHAISTRVSLLHLGTGCLIRQLTTFGVKSKNRHDERPWVGRNVDFGVNVTCIGNIHIGDNAIIAAGSVVVKDVPANAIVAGNPAKVIKYRNENTVN
jgi:acetyltransferase-like isoleucine patch superfamily enzyme